MTDAIQKAREALETARDTLSAASRQLTDYHKIVLGGKRWGEVTSAKIDAALAALDAETDATALERVTRERDEAHLRTAYLEEEVVRTRDAAVERVRTAEAKLAEARKVIERIRSEASSWHASYSFARLIADIARSFLEETK